MSNIFIIYYTTKTMNNLHYQNANRFMRSKFVEGYDNMLVEIESLKNDSNVTSIKRVTNSCGKTIKL